MRRIVLKWGPITIHLGSWIYARSPKGLFLALTILSWAIFHLWVWHCYTSRWPSGLWPLVSFYLKLSVSVSLCPVETSVSDIDTRQQAFHILEKKKDNDKKTVRNIENYWKYLGIIGFSHYKLYIYYTVNTFIVLMFTLTESTCHQLLNEWHTFNYNSPTNWLWRFSFSLVVSW